MKIIKPSVGFFGAVPTEYNAALKFIEMAGRTCYKSEDKITEDSAEKFVRKLIKAEHLAMVEHSNFVVRANNVFTPIYIALMSEQLGKYFNIKIWKDHIYVGGNLTAWAQTSMEIRYADVLVPFVKTYGKLFDQSMIAIHSSWQVCPHDEIPKELHRYSAKFICDRGVSHELVRHRPCSFAQESTRYVNYAGKDMEFIEPADFDDWQRGIKEEFKSHCNQGENMYNLMLRRDLKPQQARAVLPNALKTEIIVTADAAEWKHIKNLRTSKAAHPDIQRVMNMMPWEEFL